MQFWEDDECRNCERLDDQIDGLRAQLKDVTAEALEMQRTETAFQKWLSERAEWLHSEAHGGGDWEHLRAREDECRYIAARFEKLTSEDSGNG